MTAALMSGRELFAMLTNVLPHTERDNLLPVLGCVRFGVTATTVELAATDRYSLAIGAVAATDTRDGDFLLNRVDCATLLRLVKPVRKTTDVPVTVECDGTTVTVTTAAATLTFPAGEGTFPHYPSLLPTGPPSSIPGIALGMEHLAKLGKLINPAGTAMRYLSFTLYGALKPVDVTANGLDNFRALLMPINMQNGGTK